MAVVLNSEENSYFSSGPLRRSHSQPKFGTTSSLYSKSPCRSLSSNGFPKIITEPVSVSSPRLSKSRSSYSTQSLREESSCISSCGLSNEPITFPSYHEDYFQHTIQISPPLSPQIEESYIVSPILSPSTTNTSTNVSRPQSPDLVEHAEDDSAVRIQPSRHVDYLSHNWCEEDIWSSWKHVVSRRKSYSNASRLENASWRSWVKAKYKLKTVSPETLNWLKDCDVTWLYGPLQTSSQSLYNTPYTPPTSCNQLSKTSSFLNKKPILKKRSMSEIMLQQSLSTSSLLKQAAAAVQAQQSEIYPESIQDCTTSSTCLPVLSTRCTSDLTPSNLSSTSSSDLSSPTYGDKKRIHFNEQVAQCIAVDVKGDDEDDELIVPDYADSDSDDGIMMKPCTIKRKYPPPRRRPKVTHSSTQENKKIIAMLPSTTLKYQSDTPDPLKDLEEEEEDCYDELWDEDSSMLSLSDSQETLRPSKPSIQTYLGDDEDDEEDLDWQPLGNFSGRNDSIIVAPEKTKDPGLLVSSQILKNNDDNEKHIGLKRSSSGMFMPLEEEESIISEGLFGKVVDTVNTAKDIAHVIWNVGWRR